MSADPVAIDVISDVVCPWCYLGKRRLTRAIGLLPELKVIVRWRPFRLDPTIPPEGIARTDYLTAKFGSLEALDESHRQLEERGRVEGVAYHFDRISRAPSTVDAHRLVRWAAAEGRPGRHGRTPVRRLFQRGPRYRRYRSAGRIGGRCRARRCLHRRAAGRRPGPRGRRRGDRECLSHRRLGRALLHHRPAPGGDRGAPCRGAGAGDRAGRRRARGRCGRRANRPPGAGRAPTGCRHRLQHSCDHAPWRRSRRRPPGA